MEKIETRSGTNMKFAPHFRIRPRLTTLHQKKKVLQGWSRVFNTDVPEIIISFVDHGDYLFWVTNLMMMSQYFSIRTWFGNKTWKWAAAPLPHHPTRACWRAFLLRILIVNILSIFSSFLSRIWVQLHTIIILTRPMVPFCTRINNLLKVFRIKKKDQFSFSIFRHTIQIDKLQLLMFYDYQSPCNPQQPTDVSPGRPTQPGKGRRWTRWHRSKKQPVLQNW